MIYSITETFKSEERKKIIYRDYLHFSSEPFKDDFMFSICQEKICLLNFEKKILDTLNKHAPKNTKTLRSNQKPHINKTLLKAIMKRCFKL